MKKKAKSNNLPDFIEKAIYGNDLQFLSEFFTRNNVNYADSDGRTLLIIATILNKISLVQLALVNGCDINIRDDKGWSALHYVAQNKNLEICRALITNNANLEIEDDFGNTPLWRATFESKGDGRIVRLLLLSGADAYHENGSKISPIKLAKMISNYNLLPFFEKNLD